MKIYKILLIALLLNNTSLLAQKYPTINIGEQMPMQKIEIFDTNDPNNITIKTTGNYLDKNRQTSITTPQQKEIKDAKEEAMLEVKKLKELLDLGIITQEEFDKKAVELKKIILGN